MRRALLVFALSACGRVNFDKIVVGDAAPPLDFAFRKQITITANADLTDMPISIVTVDSDLQQRAAADGLDIVFTTQANVVLPRELVRYDGATGALEAWVRVPAIASGTSLWMYYGGDSLAPDAAATWSGYAGVWHMSGTGAVERDTARGHDVQAASQAAEPTPATGIVGGARDYDGVGNAMSVPDPADGSLDFGAGSFSYGVWVNVQQSAGEFDMPLFKGGQSVNTPGYDIELGFNTWEPCFGDGPNQDCMPDFGTEGQFAGEWASLVMVIDRATQQSRAYVAGSRVASATSLAGMGAINSAEDLWIGDVTFPFRGRIDEVRIYSGVLGDERIAAEYANLRTRSSFMTFGPEETL